MGRMAAAWRVSRHILVIAHPGIRVLTPARYLAASEPGPVTFAERWISGVCQTWMGRRSISSGPPLRAPHHTASVAGMFGGGPYGCVRPGECTLAHRGVMYLDDVADFSRSAMHTLSDTMTSRSVTHVRRGVTTVFPADFRVIATAHACPCGFLGHPTRGCTCSASAVRHHRRRMAVLSRRDDVAVVDLNRTIGGHCDPDCRGWFPSHSDHRGHHIERCDECAHAAGIADRYDDDAAERDAAAWVATSIVMQSTDGDVDAAIAALRTTSTGRLALANACGGITPEQARQGVAANHG